LGKATRLTYPSQRSWGYLREERGGSGGDIDPVNRHEWGRDRSHQGIIPPIWEGYIFERGERAAGVKGK